jgi:hypothetical protein
VLAAISARISRAGSTVWALAALSNSGLKAGGVGQGGLLSVELTRLVCGFQAAGAACELIISNSIGVSRPSLRCRLRRW